jgi:hypothetical protein
MLQGQRTLTRELHPFAAIPSNSARGHRLAFDHQEDRTAMLTFTTIVSRKTPLDGKLEIPASLADRLLSTGLPLLVSVAGTEVPVSVETMPCTCAKGTGASHEHHFLAAEPLRALAPNTGVTLLVDLEGGRIELDETP